MNIRRANENDIPRLIELLEQVLQIHADIRPDIFIPGTTKYTNEELSQMIKDDTKPIYVSAMHSVSCWSSHFPTIWCRLPHFLSMICASMQVPEDSTSERSCLCM
jgi:hypothetical protein